MTATIPITQQHGEETGGPMSPVVSVMTGDKAGNSNSGSNPVVSRNANPVTPAYLNSTGSESYVGVDASLSDDDGLLLPGKFIFPRCQQDLSKADLEPVENFVATAISSEHGNKSTNGQANADDIAKAAQSYRALATSLRRPEDPEMLRKIFIALRTAGKGSSLYQLACFPDRHAHLIHLICKFNPFDIPLILENAPDETKLPYHDYSLADAYMHLVVAIISANSVHVVSFMSAIWRTLTLGKSEIQEAS